MFQSDFYFASTRKYVTMFGTLFNDINITRTDANNTPIETLKVPIAYGPKEPMLARLTQDPNLNKKVAIKLPRMGFELTSMNYAADRKLQSVMKNTKAVSNNTRVDSQYVPVPYDMSFSLYIMAKNAEDGSKIIEQILPYFTPEFTPSLNLIPEMGITMDIPVVLINVTSQDTYESNFIERRALTWTLDFIVKGYFFGPIKRASTITLANTNFYDYSNNVPGDMFVSVAVTPGQLANGAPTSNASLTVDRDSIAPNSSFGYVVTYT
jgi:hypothetical protein